MAFAKKFRHEKKILSYLGTLYRLAKITLIHIYKACLLVSHCSIRGKFDSRASVKQSRRDVQTIEHLRDFILSS